MGSDSARRRPPEDLTQEMPITSMKEGSKVNAYRRRGIRTRMAYISMTPEERRDLSIVAASRQETLGQLIARLVAVETDDLEREAKTSLAPEGNENKVQ